MNARVLFQTLGSLLLITAMVGCAGSDDPPLTRAQYLKRADAICARAEKEQFKDFQAALDSATNGHSVSPPAEKKAVQELSAELIIPRAAQMVDELADLEAPEGNEHVVEELIEIYRAAVKAAENQPSSFLSGKAFAEANEAAKGYGLQKCTV
jgi:hypothetical protein